MEIAILYETDNILAINKPAGVMVHHDGKSKDKVVLTDWILEHYPDIATVGENMGDIARPGIVHRLDEDTSGVLLIAKNQDTFLFLKEQFQNRTIKKEYNAFAWGHFKESAGVIDVPIGRNKNDFRRWHAGRGTRGELREAVTHWNVVQNFSDENDERLCFLSLAPLTGRTHQLRVHLQYLQRPIVCDSLYGPSKPAALGFGRLALHARSIAFIDREGQKQQIIAPYPADFEEAIAKYCPL